MEAHASASSGRQAESGSMRRAMNFLGTMIAGPTPPDLRPTDPAGAPRAEIDDPLARHYLPNDAVAPRTSQGQTAVPLDKS